MKKICLLLCTLILLGGCEKKEPDLSTLLDSSTELTLSIWTTEYEDFFEALGREFLSQKKVSGEVVVRSFSTSNGLEMALLNALAEGRGPDVVFIDGDWVLSNRAKILAAEPTAGFQIESLRTLWIEAAQDVFLGESYMYGIPLGADTLALLFNQSISVDRLGEEELPLETWKDLPGLAEQLVQKNNSFERFAIAALPMGRVDNVFHMTEVFENILFQRDFSLFTSDQRQATLTQEGVSEDGKKYRFGLDTLNFLRSFSDPSQKHFTWNASLASNKGEKAFDTFLQGKVAMVFAYARDLHRLKERHKRLQTEEDIRLMMDSDIRTVFLPQFKKPSLQAHRRSLARVFGFVVPRTAAQPQVSWSFLRFAHQSDIARTLHQSTGLLSVQYPLLLEQESDPLYGVFARQLKTAQVVQMPIRRRLLQEGFESLFDRLEDGDAPLKALEWLEEFLTEHLREAAGE